MKKKISVTVQKKRSLAEAAGRQSLSETKLRRIIRDELARQYLLEEGLLDNLKKPFQKLGEKAKKYISEKSEEILSKISKISDSLKDNKEVNSFFKEFEKQKNGKSFEELTSSVPEYSKLKKQTDAIKEIDFSSLMKKSQVSETLSLQDLRMSIVLAEEKYNQKIETGVITESVIGAAAAVWWGSVKIVVGACGLISFACNSASKMCDYLGLKKVSSVFKKIYHFVEHIEELFLDKIAFPKPVQYAVFRAMWAIKYSDKGEPLSYEKFVSEEGKEERAAALKTLHTAVIFILVVQALHHIVEGLIEFFHSMSSSASEMVHAAGHAAEKVSHGGVETSNLSKAAKAASLAGEEMASAAGEMAGARSVRV